MSLSANGAVVAYGQPNVDDAAGAVLVYNTTSGAKIGSTLTGDFTNDEFGMGVSLSDDGMMLAVGAPAGDTTNGYVRVYELTAGAWVQLGGDFATPGARSDFGGYVSLSGTTVAIGEPTLARVQVHNWMNGGWTQVGEIIQGGSGDGCGMSVSVRELRSDGTAVAIGCPTYLDERGGARVYGNPGGSSSWVQTGETIIGEDIADRCGLSVSLSSDGRTLAVGSPYVDIDEEVYEDAPDAGAVRVFQYDDTSVDWDQRGRTITGPVRASALFGRTVSLSADGEVLAVGVANALEVDHPGTASAFKWSSEREDWTSLAAVDGDSDKSLFGYHLQLSGDGEVLVVGAPLEGSQGAVRVFGVVTSAAGQGRFTYAM